MNIAIRADASTQIGSGHVMRCLSLADTLRQAGAEVIFICRELPGHQIMRIESEGFMVHRLAAPATTGALVSSATAYAQWLGVAQQQDALDSTETLASSVVDWLVVDHYGLDATWERAMRSRTRRILAIDDIADRRHDCELLLDQNLHLGAARRYRDLVPRACRRLLGPRYALLRPEFAHCRSDLPERKGSLDRVLIFFGGVDEGNYTSLALRALSHPACPDLQVDVVVGAANPHRAKVEQLCAGLQGCRLHVNTSQMATLMANADLAIGAGGGSTWERACLRLPSIVIAVAENQQELANSMAAKEALMLLPTEATPQVLAEAIHSLAIAPERMREMARISGGLVDGRGAGRVAREMLANPLGLRLAVRADSSSLHIWRNSNEVRRFSRNPVPIALADHEHWLANVLADSSRDLLIAEEQGEPVGVLRYDRQGAQAIISIYLVPGHSGQGLGPRILLAGDDWLATHHPEIEQIRAEVLSQNTASQHAFAEAGYEYHVDAFIKRLQT